MVESEGVAAGPRNHLPHLSVDGFLVLDSPCCLANFDSSCCLANSLFKLPVLSTPASPLQMVTAAMKLKDAYSLEGKLCPI